MLKKIVLFLLVLFIFSFNKNVYAICNEGECDSQSEYESYISELNSKIYDLNNTKDTLSNQIKLLDSQVELTLLKITQTKGLIKALEGEIAGLSTEIGKLDVELDQLSELYIHQVIENYKLQKRIPTFTYLFSSKLNNFLEQYKYITSLQKNNQNSLLNMETARTNYDIQKQAKEEKQNELENLQKTLAGQKNSLNSQKASKNRLLDITKNDASKYQNYLTKARNQLSAFGTFTSGSASLLSNQTYCDSWGCYYSQRDSEWGNIVFGYDYRNGVRINYDMRSYGCLLTSTTMILTHYGKSIKPSALAIDSSLFFGHSGDMLQGGLSTNGINFSRNTIGCGGASVADSELNSGRPVIAGVGGSCWYPAHFIVIKYKKDGQYIVNDPYRESAHDKSLSSTGYNVVRIDAVRVY